MMERIEYMLAMALILLVPPANGHYREGCSEYGWFGSECQYKCHTGYSNCGDGGCERGWFGPECQYADLLATHSIEPTPKKLNDNNHTTCTDNRNLQQVILSLEQAFPFTWLRLRIRDNDLGLLLSLNVELHGSNNGDVGSVMCKNMRKIPVNNRTLDFYCDGDTEVQNVTVSGDGVKSLCSALFSGGRNIALKQKNITQSSTYEEDSHTYGGTLAVDGNADGDFYSHSCTHTKGSDPAPNWRLYFSQPKIIYRYVLYNRDSDQERLQGFTLTSSTKNGQAVFQHQDKKPYSKQAVYTVTSFGITTPVFNVNITSAGSKILTLCEVEIYGDNACDGGKFGRECKDICNYCKTENDTCEIQSGVCSVCNPGFTGAKCDLPCPSKYHGSHCKERCSTDCTNQLCGSATGYCYSCVPGKRGDFCDKDCPDGKYGTNCLTNCSENCIDKRCDPVNGTCSSGCNVGYRGAMCDATCETGMYGRSCSLNCSENCEDTQTGESPCHHVTGSCAKGCLKGYSGPKCSTKEEARNADDNNGEAAPLGVIVGAVVGIVVVVALVVGGILLWKRRNTNRKSKNESDSEADNKLSSSKMELVSVSKPLDAVETSATPARQGTIKDVTRSDSQKLESTAKLADTPEIQDKARQSVAPKEVANHHTVTDRSPTAIAVKDLGAFIKTQPKELYTKQFLSIPENKDATTTVGQSNENKPKHRYKNISAYDHSRVHLHIDEEKGHGDYINASYLEGFQAKEKFIASQAPTKNIMEDFVRMLWEQRVDIVVMLTNLVEEGKMKSEQYWPDEGETKMGEIKVKLTTTDIFADYTIRRLYLSKEGEEGHLLTQFHFTSWPDKDVPITPWGLVDFEQRVASYATDKPIVVHCSAGVGRTGTFIALRNVMREAEDTGYVDFFTTVQKLRHDRINMVQTAEQYEFLHYATQVAIVCMGTTVTSSDIEKRIDKLETKASSGETYMEKEFKAICAMCVEEDDIASTATPETQKKTNYENSDVANKVKDRFTEVPAKEYYRAILKCENNEVGDYINAVFVPSFRRDDGQFLSQLPLPKTVTDFWRMVTQYQVCLVVAFEMDLKAKDSSIGDYLPANVDDALEVPLFKITVGPVTTGDVFEKQRVIVSANEKTKRNSGPGILEGEHRLIHLKAKKLELTPDNMLEMIRQIRSHNRGDNVRTVFLCRNGATYSGLVCVLTLLLDRMDHDLRLTVPLVVGAIKAIRPQVIPTLEQYKLLYQVLQLYNESNNVYGNVGQSRESQAPASTFIKEADDGDKDAEGQVYANV